MDDAMVEEGCLRHAPPTCMWRRKFCGTKCELPHGHGYAHRTADGVVFGRDRMGAYEPDELCSCMSLRAARLERERDAWKARAEKAEAALLDAEAAERASSVLARSMAKAEERARIVAWLRKVGQPYGRWDDEDVREIADAIERGEG